MDDNIRDKLAEADKELEAGLLKALQPLLDAPTEFKWHSTEIQDGELVIWFEEASNPDHVWQVKMKMGDDLSNVPAALRRLTA